MAEYMIQGETLTDIADAIRAKGGTSSKLSPSAMVAAIENISVGVDTSDATATAANILSGKTAYAKGVKITGTISTRTSSNLSASGATVSVPAGYYASTASKSVATATQATPSISVSAAGLITASATQNAGYVTAGTKSGTKQLTVQAAKTVTPTTSEQTAVASGVYTTGAVKVAAMPTATQATPAITVDASTGLITASATQTAGYVSAGTKSAEEQLTTQAAKTVTPSTSEQTAVASNVYTTGEVKVAAVPTETKTVTPSSSVQSITPTSGKFLSAVTVEGDENLLADNIKEGVSIFGVAGTLPSNTETILYTPTEKTASITIPYTLSEINGFVAFRTASKSASSSNYVMDGIYINKSPSLGAKTYTDADKKTWGSPATGTSYYSISTANKTITLKTNTQYTYWQPIQYKIILW